MVTGDHPTTAAAVAQAVGIPVDGVMTGADLDRMTESERVRRAAETTVFARVSPEQKLRIVEALQAAGNVVAMTGDGTNDAAAIRMADVGIGVAAPGTSAASSSARSAADMVIAGADVRRIHDAMAEGRGLGTGFTKRSRFWSGAMLARWRSWSSAPRSPAGHPSTSASCSWSTCSPTCSRRSRWRWPRSGTTDVEEPRSATLGAPLARAIAVRGGATALGAMLAWIIGRYTGRRRRASTMGLAALVGTQLGQTLLTGWRTPLIVATASPRRPRCSPSSRRPGSASSSAALLSALPHGAW